MKPTHSVWPVVKLRVACQDFQPGFARQPNDSEDGILQLRMPSVSRSGFIDLRVSKFVDATDEERSKYAVRSGDVVFNNTNSPERVGNAAAFDRDVECVLSNHMTRIRVQEAVMAPAFLAAVLHQYWKTGQTQKRAKQWINQASIDVESLANFRIPLPPLSEQHRIVKILHEAEEIRRLRAQAEAKTAELIPSIFQEIFGDLFSTASTLPRQSLVSIGELDRGRSKHRPRDEPSLYGGKYPFLQTGDIANAGGWVTSYSQAYSEKGFAQSRLWPKGTLAITIAANIGATAILTFDACFPDSIVGFTPHDGISVEYVRWWLMGYQKKLELQAPQGAQKNINLEVLRSIQIPVPPEKLQMRFRDAVLNHKEQMEHNERASREFALLSASLSAHAFSGQLTADWREKHKQTLGTEARKRDKVLEKSGTALTRGRSATLDELDDMFSPRTDGIYAELNREQRELLLRIQRAVGGVNYARYFTAEQLAARLDGALHRHPQAIEAHLSVFAARGLIIPVSREEQTKDTGEYVFGNAYRLPIGDKDLLTAEGQSYRATVGTGEEAISERIPGDLSRLREMERLVMRMEKERMPS